LLDALSAQTHQRQYSNPTEHHTQSPDHTSSSGIVQETSLAIFNGRKTQARALLSIMFMTDVLCLLSAVCYPTYPVRADVVNGLEATF
jgi:hypothetical protein